MLNPCSLCTARCCKQHLITVTSFDILKIHENTKKPIEEFAELADPRILNIDNDTVLEFYDSSDRYPECRVLAIKSGPCHFLTKDDRCSIHEFAPLTCKRYPFGPDGKITKNAVCPAISKVLFSFMKIENERFNNNLKAYKEIVKKWNTRRGKLAECMNFLMEESKKENGTRLVSY